MKRLINTIVILFAMTLLIVQGTNADTIVTSDRVVSYVNVRAEANRNADVVGSLAPGESAEHLDSVTHWFKVKLSDDTVGYVNKGWTRFVSNIPQTINTKQQVSNLEQRVGVLEKKVKRIDEIDKKISNQEVEILFAKKNNDFAKEKLEAADYTFKTTIALIGAIALLGAGIMFIIRHLIIEKIKKLMVKSEELTKKNHQLFAYSKNRAAVNAWRESRYNQAIIFAEECIECAIEAWTKEPEDDQNKETLNKYRSNLAYFYVEKKRTEMKGKAIEYAKLGLQTGERTNDFHLIDNYLFVIKRFSNEIEDKKDWIRVFETYKDDIYKKKIREPGDEQKEFDQYYDRVKREVKYQEV